MKRDSPPTAMVILFIVNPSCVFRILVSSPPAWSRPIGMLFASSRMTSLGHLVIMFFLSSWRSSTTLGSCLFLAAFFFILSLYLAALTESDMSVPDLTRNGLTCSSVSERFSGASLAVDLSLIVKNQKHQNIWIVFLGRILADSLYVELLAGLESNNLPP